MQASIVQFQKFRRAAGLVLENAVRFAFSIGFIYLFQWLFGPENILVGVAISVAITMLPICDTGLRPRTMAAVTFGLTVGAGTAAQLSVLSPWLALPFDFLIVAAILLMSGEPMQLKMYVCHLLTFVFAQATVVPMNAFPKRMLCLVVGGALLSAAILVWWKRKGYGKEGKPLPLYMRLCWRNRGLILRMSAGIALAMLIAALLGLKKPLWISIVVMSLTQVEFQDTIQRIKHRTIGTLAGIAIFIVVFRMLIPEQYSMAAILVMGYLSFFLPDYKYKQAVNAVNALNASLVLLDTTTAIAGRCLCLLGGIAIVLLLNLIQRYAGPSLARMYERTALRLRGTTKDTNLPA